MISEKARLFQARIALEHSTSKKVPNKYYEKKLNGRLEVKSAQTKNKSINNPK